MDDRTPLRVGLGELCVLSALLVAVLAVERRAVATAHTTAQLVEAVVAGDADAQVAAALGLACRARTRPGAAEDFLTTRIGEVGPAARTFLQAWRPMWFPRTPAEAR